MSVVLSLKKKLRKEIGGKTMIDQIEYIEQYLKGKGFEQKDSMQWELVLSLNRELVVRCFIKIIDTELCVRVCYYNLHVGKVQAETKIKRLSNICQIDNSIDECFLGIGREMSKNLKGIYESYTTSLAARLSSFLP